ncbi:hypothetical protein MC885_009376 [Smutsia gigantea]|nr:hypothetical protein MC885_009376 [Smutsia gigantea]
MSCMTENVLDTQDVKEWLQSNTVVFKLFETIATKRSWPGVWQRVLLRRAAQLAELPKSGSGHCDSLSSSCRALGVKGLVLVALWSEEARGSPNLKADGPHSSVKVQASDELALLWSGHGTKGRLTPGWALGTVGFAQRPVSQDVAAVGPAVEHIAQADDGRYCFVFALGYLTVCQITRVYIFDYGQYSADFSGARTHPSKTKWPLCKALPFPMSWIRAVPPALQKLLGLSSAAGHLQPLLLSCFLTCFSLVSGPTRLSMCQ